MWKTILKWAVKIAVIAAENKDEVKKIVDEVKR